MGLNIHQILFGVIMLASVVVAIKKRCFAYTLLGVFISMVVCGICSIFDFNFSMATKIEKINWICCSIYFFLTGIVLTIKMKDLGNIVTSVFYTIALFIMGALMWSLYNTKLAFSPVITGAILAPITGVGTIAISGLMGKGTERTACFYEITFTIASIIMGFVFEAVK